MWGGEQVRHPYNATQTPIVVSAAYGYDDIDVWYDVALGKAPGFIYSRISNPTVETVEAKIRELEMAESAVAFSSGMAAISSVLYTSLANGDRVVSTKDSYGGTNKIFEEFLPRTGVAVTLCETFDHEEIEREIAKVCQVLYLETPTNPTLKILDIPRLVAAAKRVGALVVADNTFATPLNQNPLALGVDVVIHSATKFLSGPMITQQAAQNAEQVVNEALQQGATLLCGHRRQGNCYAATVLENVDHSSRIWGNEAFAPVVVLQVFETFDEAIALANEPEYALHAGIFTNDLSTAMSAARRIEAGGVMINDSSDFRFDAMPFDGSKYGSLGREGVRFAYEEMTQPKVVCLNVLG